MSRDDRKTVILSTPRARDTALQYVREAPEGFFVVVEPAKKKRIQEERYHAMIGDIAKQCDFMGQRWHTEDWKRLLVDLFAAYMRELGTPLHHDGRVLPSLDHKRIVQLGIQTREFYVREASDFIEFLFAFGAERGVVWSEKFRDEVAA